MSLQLGSTAPDFTAETTLGKLNFHEWLGESWGVLFSHPAAFTPVCTTELGRVAALTEDFKKRGVKVIALSVDNVETQTKWLSDIKETQNALVDYPLICDPNREVATLYDMLPAGAENTLTVRKVFIIGPDKKIKLSLTYPASTGRNFDEILRVIDSLQLTAKHQVATPVDWKQGEDCIIVPAVSNEEAEKKFPKGFKKIKEYLRYTPQPAPTPKG